MNKLLTFALFTILFCLNVMAQNPTFTVISFDGQNLFYNDNSGKLKSIAVTPIQMAVPPSGSCIGMQTAINTTTGNLYYCNSTSATGTGVWTATSGVALVSDVIVFLPVATPVILGSPRPLAGGS